MKRPVQSDWTGSIVVRHDQQNEVAIDFILGCPCDLGLAATLGIDLISSVFGMAGSDRFSNPGDWRGLLSGCKRNSDFGLKNAGFTFSVCAQSESKPRSGAENALTV